MSTDPKHTDAFVCRPVDGTTLGILSGWQYVRYEQYDRLTGAVVAHGPWWPCTPKPARRRNACRAALGAQCVNSDRRLSGIAPTPAWLYIDADDNRG